MSITNGESEDGEVRWVVVCLVYFVFLVERNQRNQRNQIDQTNQTRATRPSRGTRSSNGPIIITPRQSESSLGLTIRVTSLFVD